jgi:holo-[acyl-carrier protein] synthase
MAARFAAKEAVAKALGTGIGPLGVKWTDIVIRRLSDAGGLTVSVRDGRAEPEPAHPAMLQAPQVILNGGALNRYLQIGGLSISVSLSHDGGLAMAYCVLLHEPSGTDPEVRSRHETSQEPMP